SPPGRRDAQPIPAESDLDRRTPGRATVFRLKDFRPTHEAARAARSQWALRSPSWGDRPMLSAHIDAAAAAATTCPDRHGFSWTRERARRTRQHEDPKTPHTPPTSPPS